MPRDPTGRSGARSTVVPVVTLTLAVMILAVLEAHGWRGEDALRAVVRATARSSLLLFLGAFLASTFARRWPGPFTRWLLANRRGVGLSFAVSHLFHGVALVLLVRGFPAVGAEIDLATRIGGGLGFAVVALLAVTSNDVAVRRLGGRRWSQLHLVGVYFLWAVFVLTYADSNRVLAGVLVAALVLRLRTR